ncbi:membrane protein [Methylopila jiangsuensis]|uniref:Membrane protein n=1 Tax=Methylopila jiangsuensis TaxID=586230 RepID=A0A9W6JKV3_9HYPH|nr:peptidoglycan DD-metalloendopeptidase family protein [Methylopila jiangsuensis]MDR6284643.1 septal ring factor EnvC (AmiA/AmiB activator) [Methylopila jiangsuensis]GLK77969.1 membrane protein [Methylopila jiangsuensis]
MTRRTLAFVLAACCALSSAHAQDAAPAEPEASAAQRRALDEAREKLKLSEEARQRIAAEIEAMRGERGKLQEALVASAAAIREREPQVQQRETRLSELGESERQLKASLEARRGVLAEVIATLQRMGRKPPPALLVRPRDALEAVRSAILLGAVVPDMRAEAEELASDLREMERLKGLMTRERDALAGEIEQLGEERARVAALMEERQRQLGQREQDLTAEAGRSEEIGREVRDLEALVARVEREIADTRAAAEKAAEDARRRGDLAALESATRLAPAMPFEQARGKLPFPAAGPRLVAFGRPNGPGGPSRGVSIGTRPGAPVSAPCDGWVVYAGPFRSYGQLLILDAGGGYHVLLAGMDRITVGLKQFVLAGEPVATMSGDPSGAEQAAGASRPVLYVEFRKNGGAIDPSPWWAGAPGEKVGG